MRIHWRSRHNGNHTVERQLHAGRYVIRAVSSLVNLIKKSHASERENARDWAINYARVSRFSLFSTLSFLTSRRMIDREAISRTAGLRFLPLLSLSLSLSRALLFVHVIIGSTFFFSILFSENEGNALTRFRRASSCTEGAQVWLFKELFEKAGSLKNGATCSFFFFFTCQWFNRCKWSMDW